MKYTDFENVMTTSRMSRYLVACSGNNRKSMTLYRRNLILSQELFTTIGCFEIALRNSIDRHYTYALGNDWLKNGALPGGVFDTPNTELTRDAIRDAMRKLNRSYTHFKLVAELGFGFWRYLFASYQYTRAGSTLLRIFPQKPLSTPALQYNQGYIFNQLASINKIRNRIAHHEPICFVPRQPIKDTSYARQNYNLILQLFKWMNIDEHSLLYGVDHVSVVCDKIDLL